MIYRCISALALTFAAGFAAAQATNGVPASLLAKFKTGVNVTRWFCYVQNPADTNHFKTYLNDQDFAAFKRLHVSFVRLCVSPEVGYDNGAPNATNLPYIDAALDRFKEAGIAVLWDLHDNGQLKLDTPGQDNSGFVRFWEALARHYKGQRENEIVFELVNEPVFRQNPQVWYALQEQTVKAVRAIDPSRSIMVTGTNWGGIDTLVKMQPLGEKNLIYSFHCYDPFFFTHQGASWVGDVPKLFKSVPFPSSPEAVDKMIDEIPSQYQSILRDYGAKRYGEKYLQYRIESPAAWGRAHQVPVVLGEFGAYPPVSPVASRSHWFEAMRAAIDAAHVPHAIWGYDDALGLGRTMGNGKLHLDPVVLKNFYGQ